MIQNRPLNLPLERINVLLIFLCLVTVIEEGDKLAQRRSEHSRNNLVYG